MRRPDCGSECGGQTACSADLLLVQLQNQLCCRGGGKAEASAPAWRIAVADQSDISDNESQTVATAYAKVGRNAYRKKCHISRRYDSSYDSSNSLPSASRQSR